MRGDHSEHQAPRPGPFITRVINCGEIIAEPARGDQGARVYRGGHTHSAQISGWTTL